MTRDNDFKRLVRARMQSTGERYTAARAALLHPGKEERMISVTCEVRVNVLTEDEKEAFPRWRVTTLADEEIEPLLAEINTSNRRPFLLLKEIDGPRRLAIFVGPVEATSVAFALKGVQTPRPMTHDLLRDVVVALGEAREVRVTDLRDKTFFAELLVLDRTGAEQTISCRPSDGLAFALRADIPILVEESLFERARPDSKGDE